MVGGLDLFPPQAAIRPIDYIDSLDEVGIELRGARRAATVAARWPQFRPAERRHGAPPARRRDRAGRARHPDHAGAGDRGTAPTCGSTARSPAYATSGSAGSRSRPPRRRSTAAASSSAPTPGSTTCSATSACEVPLEVTLEQVTYFQPDEPGALRAGAAAAVDLDGRPVLLRLPDLRRADGQGGPGLRRPDRRPRAAYVGARPGDGAAPRRVHGRRCCRAAASRCGRCAASTR